MNARLASTVGACAAIAALVAGLVFGTYAAGGSDSSCYLNTARLLARRHVGLDQPLAREAPLSGRAVTPAGFTPSPADPAFLVPICPPGLALMMAGFRWLRLSEFLVVPLLGALSVWLTFVLGRAVDRPLTGAAAAVLVAASPTFLYQIVQPMSDVPAAAWWLLALVWALARHEAPVRPVLSGLAASLAVATRPNLVPLAAVIAGYLFIAGDAANRYRHVVRFAAGLVPGAVVLALLQRAMYGSSFATGYGNLASLMGGEHVLPNLGRYLAWLTVAHTPVLLLALAAPAVLRQPRRAWFFLAFVAVTFASYLPYLVFDDWWYTRFLLPAIPLLMVLSAAVLVWLAARALREARSTAALTIACVAALAFVTIRTAAERQAFALAAMEQHYFRAGRAVADHVRERAIVVTLKDSGSVQYYAGQPILSWDTLEPEALEPALALARSHGYTPYLLFESDEEPVFRDRFKEATPLGHLDWPPRVQAGRSIRLYDPRDREPYRRDGVVHTRFIGDTPVPSRDWRRWFRFEPD